MCCRCMNRREFMGSTTAMMVAAGMAALPVRTACALPPWEEDLWDPARPFAMTDKPLTVQPVLMYRIPERREMDSWKSWGGVQTPQAVEEEAARIAGELDGLVRTANFPMEIRPVLKVDASGGSAPDQVKNSDADVVILYPAGGGGGLLKECLPQGKSLVFLRHRSGPVYYWYEAMSHKYMRTDAPVPGVGDQKDKPIATDDVVVDETDELLWRLRARHAMKNFAGSRVVALGGAAGKYAGDAPAFAREKLGLDIVEVGYEEFEPRVKAALADGGRMALCEKWTDAYLALPGTTLATERSFVVNSFILYGLFKEMMAEHNAQAFTINSCMGTIMPMSRTTACLTLSLMNDEGLPAFCESDFVIVPACLLMQRVARTPVFLHNSTFPHKGIVTCAHCTGPRRMDGGRYEPAIITTHYESEYGAAPKVEMPVGSEVSFIDPEYATGRWVGARGTVEDNPFLEICRSQQDVRIHGDWKRLIAETRDSHWVMAYGNHLREIGYAAPRMGITWDNISEEA